jgi:AcrR family transcriptional regulator
MGTIERKEREKLEMREAILNAATEMFLKEGFEKTSIRGIAEKIEYSIGTIYLYFKDKTELLNALMEQGFQKLTHVFKKIKHDSDPVSYLKTLGYTYISFALENKEYYDLMFIMKKPMEMVKAEAWSSGMKAFNFLGEAIKNCMDKDQLKFNDLHSATLIIWGFVHGLVSLYSRRRLIMFNQENIEAEIYEAMDNFINAIRK